MKTCSKCGEPKNESDFYLRDNGDFRKDCKSCHALVGELWRKKNLEKVRRTSVIATRKWRTTNRAQARKNASAWKRRNRPALNGYYKNRYHSDPTYKLSVVLRARQQSEIKRSGGRKAGSALELTGCSYAQLWAHLESYFKPGMTKENHGAVWHIDHKRPISSFDLREGRQQRACFHWTNLQPLFAAENLQKSDNFPVSCRE